MDYAVRFLPVAPRGVKAGGRLGKGKPDFCSLEQRGVAGGGKKASLLHQEAVGGDDQGGMVMKAAPVPAFEMSQPEFLLKLLIVALDAPASFRNSQPVCAD